MLDAPDAQLYWAAQRPLLISWLVSSVLSLAFFFPFYLGTGLFITGEIAACLGIAGSAIHVCSACGSGLDARNQIRITHSMAGAAAALDIFTVFLAVLVLLGVECGGGGGEGSAQASGDVCNYLVVYVLMFACYTALHSSLSLRVSQAAKNVQRLASPVSSGMVSLA